MADLVVWLQDLVASARTVSGGKGATLAGLAAGGLPIPDGVVVTTEAYRWVVDDSGIRSLLDELAAAVATTAGHDRRLRRRFGERSTPSQDPDAEDDQQIGDEEPQIREVERHHFGLWEVGRCSLFFRRTQYRRPPRNAACPRITTYTSRPMPNGVMVVRPFPRISGLSRYRKYSDRVRPSYRSGHTA